MRRDNGVHEEIAVAVVVHEHREFIHDPAGILVQVAHHGIQMPPTKEFNSVRVNFAHKEGHCATCSERADADEGRCDVGGWFTSGGSKAQLGRNICRVVGTCPHDAFADIKQVRDHVVVSNVATKFQIAVVDAACWIGERHQTLLDRPAGEWMAPWSCFGTVWALEKEHASHTHPCRIAGTNNMGMCCQCKFHNVCGL